MEELIQVPVRPQGDVDQRPLEELEGVIRRGLKTFMEVGKALASIRDRRLYKDRGYATFEDYCREEHGLGRSYVNKQIRAAKAVGEMGTTVPKPQSERLARPLTRVQDAEGRAEAWKQAVDEAEAAGEPVTAKLVEEKVNEHLLEPETTGPDAKEDVRPRPDSEQAWDRFSKLLKRLHELAAGVDQAGGVHKILRHQPEQNQRIFASDYRALAERALRQVEEFESRTFWKQRRGGE